MDRCNENSDVKVTFMRLIGYVCLGMSMTTTMGSQCLVLFHHILCTDAAPHLHSRSIEL